MKDKLSENAKKLHKLYEQYSLDDILISLFAIGAYPNNIASPIQQNFHYEALRGMVEGSFKQESVISNYEQFKEFYAKLTEVTPGFPLLEDYSPPVDFGNTEYYYDDQLYSILWGVDGSTYDQISEFELIFTENEKAYVERTKRSPSEEMKEILEFQNSLVVNLKYNFEKLDEDVEPGHIEIPSENFWSDIRSFCFTDFYDTYPSLCENYNVSLSDLSKTSFDEKKFIDEIQKGSSLGKLFISAGGRTLPILPRYGIETVIRKWKEEFAKHHLQTSFWERLNDPRKDLSVHLSLYLMNRFGSNKSHYTAMPLNKDGKPDYDNYFSSITFQEDKVIATLVAKPTNRAKDFEEELPDILSRASEALNRFNSDKPKLFLPIKSKILELRSKSKTKINYDIQIIVVLPICFIEAQPISLPKEDNVTYIFLEEYLGIVDSCETEDELIGFLEYIKSEKFFHMGILDLFGSYKDSQGVLIAGADELNVAVITPSWGSSFRYGELAKFWGLYPGIDILDDPRGWRIHQETSTRLRFVKKSMFHSMIYAKYGSAHFLQSSPFLYQEYDVAAITNLLMESLEDTFSRLAPFLEAMPSIKYSHKIEVHYFPDDFLAQERFSHLLHLNPSNEKWKFDSGRYSHIGLGVRLVYNYAKIVEIIRGAKNNQLELELAKSIIKALNNVDSDNESYKACIEQIDNLVGKPRFTQVAIKKEASHPQHLTLVRPNDTDYKKARKVTAFAAKNANLKPGRYRGEPAKMAMNTIIGTLRKELEGRIAEFSFGSSIEDLVGYVDAEIASYRYKRLGVLASRKHDVDYRRDETLAEAKREFLINHKANRYLLEKFISLKPKGSKKLQKSDIRLLMALADEIVGVYSASDAIHWDMYMPYLEIDRDFQIGTTYLKSVLKKQEVYSRRQSRLALGRIGKKSDRIGSDDVIGFAEKLDAAFKTDFGFTLSQVMAVQQVLSLFSGYTEREDAESYKVTTDEVVSVCLKSIKNVTKKEIKDIISFLALEPEKVRFILGDSSTPLDVPVWESIKRPYRYSIRPLIKLGKYLIWGPYSVNMSLTLWNRIIFDTELPANLQASTVSVALKAEHRSLDIILEKKCAEIGLRFTKFAKNIKSKHVSMPSEYGDYDCLIYIPEINAFINIEAKNLNTPKVSKDVKTQIERVFLNDKSYVSKVEKREKYLKENYQDFAKHFGITIKDTPNFQSLFITTESSFWMDYPFQETDVKFMRVDLLDPYIKRMIKKNRT